VCADNEKPVTGLKPRYIYRNCEIETGRETMTASIVGWAHMPFGKFDAETVESMVVRVATEAMADAGISASDVDEIVLGHFNAGFSPQDFTASLVLQADPALRFKPATRVENACATGSAAVHQGIKSIAAGTAKIVLVVGVEQMTKTPGPEIGKNLLRASYLPEDGETPAGFAGVFGGIAQKYFQKYGDQSDALAMIAAKNHANGVHNPYAQMRKDFGFEFCRSESDKNPFVAGPLKRTDCSLVSDGAAALVLTDSETAKTMGKAVNIRATGHAQDFLPMSKRDILEFEGCTVAWQKALKTAGVELGDLSFVETHDCFTVAELIEYEAMGLTPRGQGARAIKEGWTQKDGKLPVNPSGGLKAKGHPIGATGVSMHVLSAMQLLDQAPEGMQIKNAKLAGIFNMGGAAVANYVSILEPAK
jgi:acetyl-CoA C-acetyltransferase